MADTTIFHEDYHGPRWTYGLVHRPFGIAAQPKGHIVGSLNEQHPDYRYGTIDYPFELSGEEIYSYELVFVEAKDES
jgi:hypothetical protein